MSDELETFDTLYRNETESKPFVLLQPVKVVSVRGFMLTRLGTQFVQLLSTVQFIIVKEYREYSSVGIDDTSPFTSSIDCGEGMSLRQRDLQRKEQLRTSSNMISSVGNATLDVGMERLVFGSCNSQERPQEQLQAVNRYVNGTQLKDKKKSDLFVWQGDAVYLDRAGSGGFTREPQGVVSMRGDWTRQLYRREYCQQRGAVPIVATIDDHDYSVNDMHAFNNPFKNETRQMFLDFIDLPHARQLGYARQWSTLVHDHIGRAKAFRTTQDVSEKYTTSMSPQVFTPYNVYSKFAIPELADPVMVRKDKQLYDDSAAFLNAEYLARRTRDGVYTSHTYGPPGKRVKVILLDVRTHQNIVKPESSFYDQERETVIGEAQWAWLEKELKTAVATRDSAEYQQGGAELVFLVSGIEMVSWGKLITEGWRTFHKDRTRLQSVVGEAAKTSYINSAADGSKPTAFAFISGDVHFSEVQQTWYAVNATQPVFAQGNGGEGSGLRTVNEQTEYQKSGASKKAQTRISSSHTNTNMNHVGMENRSFVFPALEITTSGMTHGLGEMVGQRTILGNLIPLVTQQLLRHDTMEFRADRPYSAVYYEMAKTPQPTKQKAQYFRHNFFTVDIDWSKDIVEMTVRDKTGGEGMKYTVPLAFLRALDLSAIMMPGTLAQPVGAVAALGGVTGEAYLREMLKNAKLEITERLSKPVTWLIVEDLRALSAFLKKNGRFIKIIFGSILLVLFAMAFLGKKNNTSLLGYGVTLVQQLGGIEQYYCCGLVVRKKQRQEEKKEEVRNAYQTVGLADHDDDQDDDTEMDSDFDANANNNSIEMSSMHVVDPKHNDDPDRLLRFQMKLERKEITREHRAKIAKKLPETDLLGGSVLDHNEPQQRIKKNTLTGSKAFQKKWFGKVKQ